MIVLRLGKLIAIALARHDLTENQYRTLGFIDEGNTDLAEMSVRLFMKKPNLTTLIDGLEARGLVERRRRTQDRRRVDLLLTDAGRSTYEAAAESAETDLAGMARLGDRDPTALLHSLSLWASAVEGGVALLRSERSAPDPAAP
jgi:DNA-binding MarR family transcriptional regulator